MHGLNSAGAERWSVGASMTNWPGVYGLVVKDSAPLVFGTNTAERMRVDGNGNVGIGTTVPGFTLDVNGTANATGAAGALSDVRYKKNVKDLPDNAMDVVSKLRPVTFEWIKPLDEGMQGEQIGFIAQEVQKIFPQVVLTSSRDPNKKWV